jgi:hypothetical protein
MFILTCVRSFALYTKYKVAGKPVLVTESQHRETLKSLSKQKKRRDPSSEVPPSLTGQDRLDSVDTLHAQLISVAERILDQLPF